MLRLVARLLVRLRVDGLENVPRKGPFILLINHIHYLDPFVVAAAMPRPITAMSKIENFSLPVMGLIFKLWGAIPVRRGEVDRQAIKLVFKDLKDEDTLLLLAPEGTRSPDRALQEAHNGLAYIAHHSQAAIIPIAVTGTADFHYCLKHLRRTPMHLELGRPFYLRANSRRLDRQAMQDMTTEAMYQLSALLPPDHRGLYSDLDQATQHHVQYLPGLDLGEPDRAVKGRASVH
jgi:1-acyl-sn-glycerol-3-phosphate acyltransferase